MVKVFSKMIISEKEPKQYFQGVVGTRIKLYTDEGVESSGICIAHFTGIDEENYFDVENNLTALQEFMPEANVINEYGLEYEFDEPMNLNFYIANVEHPFKLYVEVEDGSEDVE